jgi:hypothetical protein
MNPSEISGQLQSSLRVNIALASLSASDRQAIRNTEYQNPLPPEVEKRLDEALAKAREQVEEVFWYYVIGDAQFGPFDEDSVIRQIQAGILNGDTLVWTLAFDAWKPIRETNLRIFVRPPPIPVSSPSLPAEPHSTGNVLIQGSNDESDISKDREIHEPTPTTGIGREVFAAALVTSNFIFFIAKYSSDQSKNGSSLTPAAALALAAGFVLAAGLMLAATKYRFQNMNASKWAWIGIILPIAWPFVLFMCLVYPPAYYPNRKLDTVGKTLTWMCILAVVGIVTAILMSSI